MTKTIAPMMRVTEMNKTETVMGLICDAVMRKAKVETIEMMMEVMMKTIVMAMVMRMTAVMVVTEMEAVIVLALIMMVV